MQNLAHHSDDRVWCHYPATPLYRFFTAAVATSRESIACPLPHLGEEKKKKVQREAS